MAPARHRRALGLAAVVLLVIGFAVVPVTRGDAAAVDTTASLVPPDALLYAHLSTKASRPQDLRLRELAAGFATSREQLPRLGMAFTPSAGTLDFDRDLRPWLGDDVAVALLAGGPMLVAAVRDREAAAALLNRLGATPSGAYKGVALKSVPPRSTAAFTEEHLVIGPATDVRGAIDRAAGSGTPSLADARVFRRAADERTSPRTPPPSSSCPAWTPPPGSWSASAAPPRWRSCAPRCRRPPASSSTTCCSRCRATRRCPSRRGRTGRSSR